jgi:outer membrane protein assembly factor BamB
VDGQEQVVLMMESEIVGVEPKTGDLLWSHPHQNRTKTNVSTPFWGADNLLFCSSAYDSGGRMLKLSVVGGKTKVEELWFQKRLRIHVANGIRLGEIIYGSSGDFGPAPFTAVNVKTGEVIWQERNLPKTSFIYADGRFIMLNEDGELILATPTATGLKIHSRVPLLTQTSWTPPTLAGSRLYLRDRKTVLALDLK